MCLHITLVTHLFIFITLDPPHFITTPFTRFLLLLYLYKLITFPLVPWILWLVWPFCLFCSVSLIISSYLNHSCSAVY